MANSHWGGTPSVFDGRGGDADKDHALRGLRACHPPLIDSRVALAPVPSSPQINAHGVSGNLAVGAVEYLQSPLRADSLGASRTLSLLRGEAKDVLVLSRKIGERILIGDKITITVVKIGHGGVRIGVEAPAELAVVREELANELKRTEQALASGQTESMVD